MERIYRYIRRENIRYIERVVVYKKKIKNILQRKEDSVYFSRTKTRWHVAIGIIDDIWGKKDRGPVTWVQGKCIHDVSVVHDTYSHDQYATSRNDLLFR